MSSQTILNRAFDAIDSAAPETPRFRGTPPSDLEPQVRNDDPLGEFDRADLLPIELRQNRAQLLLRVADEVDRTEDPVHVRAVLSQRLPSTSGRREFGLIPSLSVVTIYRVSSVPIPVVSSASDCDPRFCGLCERHHADHRTRAGRLADLPSEQASPPQPESAEETLLHGNARLVKPIDPR